jgi:hypothetical protein
LKTQFVSFRSVFAVSSSQLYKNTEADYREILNFVLEGNSMTNCDELCSQSCPNCEIVERIWPSLLHCGSSFTPFHEAHDQRSSLWNEVFPRRCLKATEPVIQLDVLDCGDAYMICFADSAEDLTKQIYVAGLLRLDLSLKREDSRILANSKNMYEKQYFISQIRSNLGINVLSEDGYLHYQVVDPRTDTNEALVKILNTMNVGRVSTLTISSEGSATRKKGKALIMEAFKVA